MFLYCNFPNWIKPEVFSFLPVRWYAVMYIVAFAIAYALLRYQCKHDKVLNSMDSDTCMDMFLYCVIGLILGARIFSTLLYNGNWYYWTHPWMIFWPFYKGRFIGLPGMSYHGGLVGAFVGAAIFAKKKKIKLAEICDAIMTAVPLGYTFGRLGNFINGELWGRCTGSSYGMIFPDAPTFPTTLDWVREAADKAGISYKFGEWINLPRHPSQLYEALGEGIILFFIMWFVVRPIARKSSLKPRCGFSSGCYLVGYGLTRFIIEYFREPDSQLGFIIAWGKEVEPTALFKSVFNISMGQILCFLMIAAGIIFILISLKKEVKNDS